ncbi:MAG: AbrB/MazE/SpoVT family DNA-binding domain-containing protein [Turicibacter sp.]
MKEIGVSSTTNENKITLPSEVVKQLNIKSWDVIQFILNENEEIIIRKKGPQCIPVTLKWDWLEDRYMVYNKKGEIIKTIFCASSLSLMDENEGLIHGRVEKSINGFKEANGYYFLSEEPHSLKIPITPNYKFYTWVDEDGYAIKSYDRLEEAIKYYG